MKNYIMSTRKMGTLFKLDALINCQNFTVSLYLTGYCNNYMVIAFTLVLDKKKGETRDGFIIQKLKIHHNTSLGNKLAPCQLHYYTQMKSQFRFRASHK